MSVLKSLKIFSISLTVLSLLIHPAYADDAVYLPKGEKAPFDGFIFTIDKSQDIRKTYLERDHYKLVNDSLTITLKLDQDIIKQLQDQKKISLDANDTLAKQLREERSMTNWERLAWTGVGAAIVLIVFYGIKATIK